VSTALIKSPLVGLGHYLDSISVSFCYIAGYNAVGQPGASTVSIVVIDATTSAELKTVYTSGPLNKYGFDKFTGYSPPVNVTVKGLQIPNGNALQLAFKFTNNQRNLQIPVTSTLLKVSVGWSTGLSPQPVGPVPGSGAATNAAAVLRGPLLFGIKLAEDVQVADVATFQQHRL